MVKTSSKTKSLVLALPAKLQQLKQFKSWDKFVPKSLLKLEKGSQGGVVLNKDGSPKFFLFDVFAFLDILSEIDERLVDKLSDEEYVDKSVNPCWWLIGEIEEKLPLSPEYIEKLRKEVLEAKRDVAAGRVHTLEEVAKELDLK